MTSPQLVAAVVLALFFAVFIGWRVASRRHVLPCPSWLGWMVELENPLARANQSGFIVEALGLSRGMRVLDAGCGPGRVTIPLAEAVGPEGTVVAADLQDPMLRTVVAKARGAGLSNVSVRQLRIGQGGLEAESFDRAVVAAVLGEVPDRPAAMRELFSCLKPGGLLAVAELVFDPHFQTRSTVRRLGHSVGFAERECFGTRFAYLLVFERPH